MFQFAKNVSFSAVDVGAMTYEKPDLIADALKNITGLFSSTALRIPSPITAFPMSQVESAFRHFYKVALTLERLSLRSRLTTRYRSSRSPFHRGNLVPVTPLLSPVAWADRVEALPSGWSHEVHDI